MLEFLYFTTMIVPFHKNNDSRNLNDSIVVAYKVKLAISSISFPSVSSISNISINVLCWILSNAFT